MATYTQRRVPVGDRTVNVAQCGNGPPLLLVHGFPLDHAMWQAQLEGLADVAHLIAPDLPGFGSSQSSALETLTMQHMADGLAELLDALGISDPVTLCGLSMGGYVALSFWQRHAERLSRLILCDTRAGADSPEAAANRHVAAENVLRQGTEQLAVDMVKKLFATGTLQEHPALVQSTVEVMQGTSPATVAAALRGMAERPDMTGQVTEIELPTLVVCGEEDAITPPSEMRQLAQSLPQASYVEIQAAGHMAPLEQGERVNAAIRQFLKTS